MNAARRHGLYFDRAGTPISPERWLALLRHYRGATSEWYPLVAVTTVGEAQVTTLWVGVAIGSRLGAPLIFETLLLPGATYCTRTPTEAAALAAHEAMVARMRELLEVGVDAPEP